MSSAESEVAAFFRVAWSPEERERSLLFVAATRTRDSLIVTSWGKPSPFLAGLEDKRPAAVG